MNRLHLWLGLTAAIALGACGKTSAPAANATPPTSAANASVMPGANDAADAKAFLDGLYAHYKSSKNNTFSPFDANEKDVFDASTIQLLAEDAKLLNGDLGVIDGDWLCACQDFVSLKAVVTVQSATPTSARATSEFVDTGMPSQAARSDRFDLVKANGVWRIHDVQTSGDPASLRQMVSREIQQLRKPRSKPAP
jgi:hypothetical protein